MSWYLIKSRFPLYFSSQMLDRYSADTRIKQLVDSFNWFILPVFNVDGYEYTWTKVNTLFLLLLFLFSLFKTKRCWCWTVEAFFEMILKKWIACIYDFFFVHGVMFWQNRNWRKTRSKHGLCTGVDPNRNWDYEWCSK